MKNRIENAICWIAFTLVPRRLAYWCAIRVMAEAAAENGDREVPALTVADCLKAWK